MKRKDSKIREAQGRISVKRGENNKARVLSKLMERPLTFSELKEAVGLSSPVLSKHLTSLTEEGLIQKALSRNDDVVYQVISQKQAVTFLGGLFSAIFLYIIGRTLSAETMDSIRRDLEKVVGEEDSQKFERELENWEKNKRNEEVVIAKETAGEI